MSALPPDFAGAYGLPPGAGPNSGFPAPAEGSYEETPAAPAGPPAPTIKVQHVSLEDRAKLEEWLEKELKDSYSDRKGLEKKWQAWVKQYDSRLPRTDRPASWQSAIDIATTRKLLQAVIARLTNPFFQNPQIITSRPREPQFDKFAGKMDLLQDYLWDQIDSEELIKNMAEDHVVYGMSIVKTLFLDTRKKVKGWVSQEVLDPLTGQPIPQQVEGEIEVADQVGAFPQSIPPSDFFWPAYATSQKTAPWLGHRFYLTEDDILDRIESQEWYDVFGALAPVGEVDPVTKTREELSGITPTEKRYEFVEVYCKKNFRDGRGKKCYIVTLNPQSGKAVRAIENYYHEYQDPFTLLYWQKSKTGLDGSSLCFVLEPYHRAVSAATNMQLDSASLAIKGFVIFTTDQEVANKWKSQEINLGDMIETHSNPKDSFHLLQLAQPQTNMSELVGVLRMDAMELSSLNPYNMGQEQNQRPTASGQAMLVEQGMEPIKTRLNAVRRAVASVSFHMAALYKQFYQNEYKFATFLDDGSFVPMLVQFPQGMLESQLFIEPVASSATMNEQTRRQEIIGVLDRVLQLDQTLLGMIQQGEQAAMQGMASGMVAGALADGLQALLYRLLQEFKVPDIQEICPPIQAVQAMGQQYAQVIQQLQAQLMQMQEVMQSLPAPEEPGGTPGGVESESPAKFA